jgi:uncharacterized protein YbjQ (UPF0145 family)
LVDPRRTRAAVKIQAQDRAEALLGVLEEADACGSDAIAGGVFYEVHGFVGEVEEFGFGTRIGGI